MPLFKKVSEERYNEMLGVLPPALHLGKGFLVGEPWTHKRCEVSGQDNTPAFMAFIRRNGEFFEADAPMTGAEFRILEPHRIIMLPPVEIDRTPRYAPARVIIVNSRSLEAGKGRVAGWNCAVLEFFAHQPGNHPAETPNWIKPELTALECKTQQGSRWYGFEKAYINSELRMVVVGFNSRDEVLRGWEVCKCPV